MTYRFFLWVGGEISPPLAGRPLLADSGSNQKWLTCRRHVIDAKGWQNESELSSATL